MCDPWDEDAGNYNFFGLCLEHKALNVLRSKFILLFFPELERFSEIQHFLKVIPFF